MDKLDEILTPEGQELTRKRAQLRMLEETLIEQEDRLAARRSEILNFERHYHQEVGARYTRRDALLAELEKLAAALALDAEGQDGAARKAAQSQSTALEATESSSPFPTPPSPRLRELYRQLARRVHPDLADGDEERHRRHAVMAEVNAAYERGDAEALQLLLASEIHAPEAVQGEGIGAELVRVIRRVHRVESGLRKVAKGLRTLAESDIGRVYDEVMKAKAVGEDTLGQVAASLDEEIAELRARLETEFAATAE